jgi:hypothetical protein
MINYLSRPYSVRVWRADQVDLILAAFFRFEQRSVGLSEQLFHGITIPRKAGQAATYRKHSLAARTEQIELRILKLLSESLSYEDRFFRMVGRGPSFGSSAIFSASRVIPENDGELVATDSSDNIVPPTATLNQGRRLLQDIVTRRMSVPVVVMLEIVYVENQKCHPTRGFLCAGDNLSSEFPDISSVLQARQVVLGSQFFKLSNLSGYIHILSKCPGRLRPDAGGQSKPQRDNSNNRPPAFYLLGPPEQTSSPTVRDTSGPTR